MDQGNISSHTSHDASLTRSSNTSVPVIIVEFLKNDIMCVFQLLRSRRCVTVSAGSVMLSMVTL